MENSLPKHYLAATVCLLGLLLPACGNRVSEEIGAASSPFKPADTLPSALSMTNGNAEIAFVSDRDGTGALYVMNADGSGQTKISRNPKVNYYNPAWSPDGQQIACSAGQVGKSKISICVMNADGSGEVKLASEYSSSAPTWSPDGKKIAFHVTFSGGFFPMGAIYVMDADGSNPIKLIEDAGDMSPSWSPDGKRIAFTSSQHVTSLSMVNTEIYVVDADGSNPTRLTDNLVPDDSPSWSPDGKQIAFASLRQERFNIYVMNADGSGQTQVTQNPFGNRSLSPSWSPDSKRLVYALKPIAYKRKTEIYTINVDGSENTRITDSEAEETVNEFPVWRP